MLNMESDCLTTSSFILFGIMKKILLQSKDKTNFTKKGEGSLIKADNWRLKVFLKEK